ncbi:MAG: V-type ATPase subunit [Candidatus Thorarchaeota archaeon]|nr:V-type ATPase subunit [Candidatus Thorarchaeota archaeon]
MATKRYALVNVRVRAMKSRFLDSSDYDRLVQSKSYERFIDVLRTTHYRGAIDRESTTDVPDSKELANILSKEFAECIDILSESVTDPVKSFILTCVKRPFIENLKSIIREIHAGLEERSVKEFFVPLSDTYEDLLIELDKHGTIRDMIEKIPYEDLKEALIAREPAFEEYRSTAPFEVVVEEWYLKEVQDALGNFSKDDRERVTSILEPRVDLQNVVTRLRALSLGLRSEIVELSMIQFTEESRALARNIEKTSSWNDVISVLDETKYSRFAERFLEVEEDRRNPYHVELGIKEYVAEQAKKQLKAFPFQLGMIVGFLTLKQYEIGNIRSLAVGIEKGMSAEIMRDIIVVW